MTVVMKVSSTKSQNQIIINEAIESEILLQPSSRNEHLTIKSKLPPPTLSLFGLGVFGLGL